MQKIRHYQDNLTNKLNKTNNRRNKNMVAYLFSLPDFDCQIDFLVVS